MQPVDEMRSDRQLTRFCLIQLGMLSFASKGYTPQHKVSVTREVSSDISRNAPRNVREKRGVVGHAARTSAAYLYFYLTISLPLYYIYIYIYVSMCIQLSLSLSIYIYLYIYIYIYIYSKSIAGRPGPHRRDQPHLRGEALLAALPGAARTSPENPKP